MPTSGHTFGWFLRNSTIGCNRGKLAKDYLFICSIWQIM